MTELMDVRYEMVISMPCVSAWRRYPWVVVCLCAGMEGRGRDVRDYTIIDVRHHGAHWVSPMSSEWRRGGGGADEGPGGRGWAFRVGEVEGTGHRL